MKQKPGETAYSETYPGVPKNYHMTVRFDLTDGLVGLTQYRPEGVDRVMLSEGQVKAFVLWLRSLGVEL